MSPSRSRGRDRARGGRLRWLTLVVVLGITFGLGVVTGRHWGDRHAPPLAAADETRKSGTGPRRGGLGEPAVERPRPRQEKLTFYHTLTAPLGETPPGAKMEAAARPEPVTASAATKTVSKPEASAERALRAESAASSTQVLRPDGPVQEARAADSAAGWAVQVGVFKNAQQAERVRKGLADGGFPVRLAPTTGDDGQPRYRVRVGAFKTRDEALKTAERLRTDRSLPTYVTNN